MPRLARKIQYDYSRIIKLKRDLVFLQKCNITKLKENRRIVKKFRNYSGYQVHG